jgi:hypothetical protein
VRDAPDGRARLACAGTVQERPVAAKGAVAADAAGLARQVRVAERTGGPAVDHD